MLKARDLRVGDVLRVANHIPSGVLAVGDEVKIDRIEATKGLVRSGPLPFSQSGRLRLMELYNPVTPESVKVGDTIRVVDHINGISLHYNVGEEFVVTEVRGTSWLTASPNFGGSFGTGNFLEACRVVKRAPSEGPEQPPPEFAPEVNLSEDEGEDKSEGEIRYEEQVWAVVDEAYRLGLAHGRSQLLCEQSLERLLEKRDA